MHLLRIHPVPLQSTEVHDQVEANSRLAKPIYKYPVHSTQP